MSQLVALLCFVCLEQKQLRYATLIKNLFLCWYFAAVKYLFLQLDVSYRAKTMHAGVLK